MTAWGDRPSREARLIAAEKALQKAIAAFRMAVPDNKLKKANAVRRLAGRVFKLRIKCLKRTGGRYPRHIPEGDWPIYDVFQEKLLILEKEVFASGINCVLVEFTAADITCSEDSAGS